MKRIALTLGVIALTLIALAALTGATRLSNSSDHAVDTVVLRLESAQPIAYRGTLIVGEHGSEIEQLEGVTPFAREIPDGFFVFVAQPIDAEATLLGSVCEPGEPAENGRAQVKGHGIFLSENLIESATRIARGF